MLHVGAERAGPRKAFPLAEKEAQPEHFGHNAPVIALLAQAALLVALEAVVLDGGEPVRGLDAEDFEVVVAGRAHPVADARKMEAGDAPRRFVFVTNRRGARGSDLQRARNGLERFLRERFAEGDRALLVDFAEVPRISRGWRNRAEALADVQSAVAAGFRSPSGAAADAADAAHMLFALAERLAGEPGSKTVVLMSGSLAAFAGEAGGALGQNRVPFDPPNWLPRLPKDRNGNRDAPGALALAFRAAGATLHAIHLEGARRHDGGVLVSSRAESGPISTTTGANGETTSAQRVWNSSASPSGRTRDAFARPTDDFLSSLASDTGGSYVARAADFARALERIEARSRVWYGLAFESPGGAYEVRVRGRPELTVAARLVPE